MKKEKRPIQQIKEDIFFFLKNHKRILRIAIFVAVTIILAFIIYRAWLNVYFLITDDLRLSVDPADASLSISYFEKPNITIDVGIENSFVCDASCDYKFTDISEDTLIENGSFTSKGIGKNFKKNFEMKVDRVGTGQKLYSFDVVCNNIRTWHCLSNERFRERKVFITLNYDLSELEQHLKEELKTNITLVLEKFKKAYSESGEVIDRFYKLGFNIDLKEFEADKEILAEKIDNIELQFQKISRLWSEEKYTVLNELFDANLEQEIITSLDQLRSLNQTVTTTLKKHNSNIDEINKLQEDIVSIYPSLRITQDKELNNSYGNLLLDLENLKTNIESNSFPDYIWIENEMENISNASRSILDSLSGSISNITLEGDILILIENERVCRIFGVCGSPQKISTVLDEGRPYKDIESLCVDLDKIEKEHSTINNDSKKSSGEITEKITNYHQSVKQDIFENYSLELENIDSNKKSIAIEILSELETNISFDINESEKEFLNISMTQRSIKFDKLFCEQNFAGLNLTKLKTIPEPEIPMGTELNITLSENFPVCCVLGECARCCEDESCEDEKLYPVLLIHGHSFNSDNSPDYSLDSFNKIERLLEKEGYVGTGTITPVSNYVDIKKGEWGQFSKPVVSKGTYYRVSVYDLGSYSVATQKSENIETYAIRLKELVDLLKFRTGKDKVTIISHSMGGLVARSYLQIFGEESVDKLIMIGTPNQGIVGGVSSFCPILGEKKECQDMASGSIFLRKLNDPNNAPKNTKVFTIIGTGCDMKGKSGDGVVETDRSTLEYSENRYLQGNCTGLSEVFHTQILDTDLYPETFETIKEILSK